VSRDGAIDFSGTCSKDGKGLLKLNAYLLTNLTDNNVAG
jgi:hypothetical protein